MCLNAQLRDLACNPVVLLRASWVCSGVAICFRSWDEVNSHVWFAFSLRKIPPVLAGKFCISSRKSNCTMRCIFSCLRSAITSSASCILHNFEQTSYKSLPNDDSTHNTGVCTLQGHSVDPLKISANNMLERLAVTNSPRKGRCFVQTVVRRACDVSSFATVVPT